MFNLYLGFTKEGESFLFAAFVYSILTRGKNFPISPKTIYTHYCIITFDLALCKYFVFAYSYATPFAHRARRNATNAVGREEGEREIILLFHRGDKISNRYLA